MEDSIRKRMELIGTVLACITFATFDPVELGRLKTLGTGVYVTVPPHEQRLEACLFGRVIRHELCIGIGHGYV